MAKLNDLQRKQIIADRAEGMSYRVIANRHGISETTVRRTIAGDPETAEKVAQKREENTATVLGHMEAKTQEVCRTIDLLLEAMQNPAKIAKAPLIQIGTVFGILIDKHAMLEKAESEKVVSICLIDDWISGVMSSDEKA